MLIFNKLKLAREQLKLTQSDAARLSGITQRDVSLLESGKKEFIPTNYIQFLYKMGISLSYIYGDDDNIFRSEFLNNPLEKLSHKLSPIKSNKHDDKLSPELSPELSPNYNLSPKIRVIDTSDNNKVYKNTGIPLYETLPASAGDFKSYLDAQQPTSYINLPQVEGCTAILPVYGSSMQGVIESGDLIAIKELQSRLEMDPVLPYLVITQDHRMIKYLRVDVEDSNVIWAESTNHKPIKLLSDNIISVYAIKCVIRFF